MSNYKVYCLTNNITGEKYIGVTKQKLYRRFKAGKGYKSNTKINKAILKYGWINFRQEVLFTTDNKDLAGKMEKFFIKFYNTTEKGYNNATGGFKGYTQTEVITEEHRKNLSLSHKGKHSSPATEFKKGVYIENSVNKKVPVICIELNQRFDSIKEAQQEFKVYHIWECIKGKRNQCGGYHWKRVGGVDNGNNN